MYARMTTLTLQQGKSEEAARIFRDSVIPVARQQKGFKGTIWLRGDNPDKFIGITLWETEADMKANENSGYYQEQVGKFSSVLAGSPTREAYEADIQM